MNGLHQKYFREFMLSPLRRRIYLPVAEPLGAMFEAEVMGNIWNSVDS